MTSCVVDEYVLAKSYFDRDGLIMAVDDGRVVGFVHAGFGPTADNSQLDTSVGATLVLMVEPREDRPALAAELLARAEEYLRRRGATTFVGGLPSTLAPFYWGVTGGSGAPGVLEVDQVFQQTLAAAGYGADTQYAMFRRRLAGFRPSFDRSQMQWRRSTLATLVVEQRFANWWESHTLASSECLKAELKLRTDVPRVVLRFWDLRPLTDSWGERGQGLLEFVCDHKAWSDGLAQFVWSEALTQMQQRGVTSVEAAVDATNVRYVDLLKSLGFQESAHSVVWKKP